MVLIGGLLFSIYLTWTEEVCVLKRTSGFVWIKNVSCISLAGCSGGRFKALKLCQSSSISGPSDTENPTLLKTSIISFLTIDIGCREPILSSRTGLVRSRSDDFLLITKLLKTVNID